MWSSVLTSQRRKSNPMDRQRCRIYFLKFQGISRVHRNPAPAYCRLHSSTEWCCRKDESHTNGLCSIHDSRRQTWYQVLGWSSRNSCLCSKSSSVTFSSRLFHPFPSMVRKIFWNLLPSCIRMKVLVRNLESEKKQTRCTLTKGTVFGIFYSEPGVQDPRHLDEQDASVSRCTIRWETHTICASRH